MPKNKDGRRKVRVRLLIKQEAERMGYTRTKLARMADVQYSTIDNIFKNEETEVTLLVLLKIARVLRCDDIRTLFEILPDE